MKVKAVCAVARDYEKAESLRASFLTSLFFFLKRGQESPFIAMVPLLGFVFAGALSFSYQG
jgi:hypothetical protein